MNPAALRKYATLVERVRSVVNEDRKARLGLHEITQSGRTYALMQIIRGSSAPRQVLLSAGIHGDEFAGVEGLCEWLESYVYLKFLHRWDITILPCLNPWGYEHGTRENGDGQDLNREFNSSHAPQEVLFVQSMLQRRVDLSLVLYGDEEHRLLSVRDGPAWDGYRTACTRTDSHDYARES